MKAKEVLELLEISKPTLTKYVKEEKIRVTVMPNGFYDYNYLYKGFNSKTKEGFRKSN
ncbi:hypothetical protein CaldiYA01_23940 [Caldicellulosiruptor diazotrophicus]|uniref:Uncharacterized protein n=1 Tax=Caldicellulosiruptor diazotrophicus TaxID=2806205 RepID=A0ABM7NQJ0_9FIRM|nr:hypothetical protein CaldiYA01_23940 [Caldicellulosiruptor diazotrophicus]